MYIKLEDYSIYKKRIYILKNYLFYKLFMYLDTI